MWNVPVISAIGMSEMAVKEFECTVGLKSDKDDSLVVSMSGTG